MKRRRLSITGNVQGVGFRPFVWRRACALGLRGWVRNDSAGVTLEIQGPHERVDEFIAGFADAAPPLSRIDSIEQTEISPTAETAFLMHPSVVQAPDSTPVSPDVSICSDCLRELYDDRNRRFRYPFLNCTNCGPRFTIIEDIPYDRSMTTMKSFRMCSECQREYDDPLDRRFHAQPNACPDCGPKVWFVSGVGNSLAFESGPQGDDLGQTAIESFRAAIGQGQVVAVKGIGGFHLVCDATNGKAIAKLRERKGRIDKPFAVMVSSIEAARSFAVISESEGHLLESRERPILLLRKRTDHVDHDMLDAVAPGNAFIGVMLPYSPLHYLLTEASPPLVMTSGNISDEPIVRNNDEARARLGSLADSFLLHNRDIHSVCDDSVIRCAGASILPIRRSRGYAPMPVRLAEDGPAVLAVGGEIKATLCVTKGRYAFVSQHIGDMSNLETLDAMQQIADHFMMLFRAEVSAVAADLHPGYLSTKWAGQFAGSLGIPLIGVQHHFAHAASLIAEGNWPTDQPMIACCFDGTGYGSDGAIWGGEFLIASRQRFERVAHLTYFPLPGGDASIKKPYRIALSHLWANGIPWDSRLPCVSACRPSERDVLRQQLTSSLNCVSTSSIGRLFDAVASLIGVRHEVTYEAQAAMELEALAASEIENVDPSRYAFEIQHGSPLEFHCENMLQRICDDLVGGVNQRVIAAQFHHAVAEMVREVCEIIRSNTGINAVGLTGGVFQNALLSELVQYRLVENAFDVLTHSIVPPNDGGLSLGQAIVARSICSRASKKRGKAGLGETDLR